MRRSARRKLLLHRAEIEKLRAETREKGLTIVPTKLYLKAGRIKVEIAVGKGKKFHDKREAIRAKKCRPKRKPPWRDAPANSSQFPQQTLFMMQISLETSLRVT